MANIFDLFKQIETKEASSAGAVTHLIVGLGNPGKEYAFTRHNAGFLTLDYMSDILKVNINRSKFKALVAEGTIGDKRVLLMQPQTFMNNSGDAVIEAVNFYKLKPENVIVFFDDISLPVGKMRIRKNGSAGGHNGIKSIIAHLGTQDFPRVKIGVGEKPHKEMDLADWVLSKFPQDEQKVLFEKFGDACEAVKLMVSGKTEEAMNKYN